MKKDPHRSVIILAYCNRYLYPFLAFLIPMLLLPLHRNKTWLMLSLGVCVLLFGVYQLVGYLLRWRHIFCSFQNAYHVEMTPDDVRWDWVKKSDAYGVPIVFGVLGIACIAVAFIV